MTEQPQAELQATPDTEPSQDEKTWGMLAHLSALAGFVVPFGSVLGPLIVWLMKKDEMPFVDDQGKESLNFQITIAIGIVICIILFVVLVGFVLLPLLGLFALIMIIMAALEANKGKRYRYPVTLRLIS
ncbi:MAG: DUF4870 domain-containing protein [Gammaproteobacteria bacterium]